MSISQHLVCDRCEEQREIDPEHGVNYKRDAEGWGIFEHDDHFFDLCPACVELARQYEEATA